MANNKSYKQKVFIKIKDIDVRYKAKKIGTFIGYFFTISLLTAVYGEKLGSLAVAFGVAGAGIAIALQDVIASFVGWLAIMGGRIYKTGDRVQLGGIKGDIMDIGVLQTTIMEIGDWVDSDLYNGRIVLVANNFIFKQPVYNYSHGFRFLWDEINIPIKYGSNYDLTKKILLQMGNEVSSDLTKVSKDIWVELQSKYRLEDTQTEPIVTLAANNNWVEFTLRYLVNYKRRRITKSELFTKILVAIEATNGDIQFAATVFRLSDVPELNIRIKQ